MGAAGHDLQPARGEVDRVADVACLRVLAEAGAGAEGQQLRTLRGGQVLAEQHEARVGMVDAEGADGGEIVERAGPHPQAVHVELELTHRLGTSTLGPYPDLPLRCRCRVWERRQMPTRRTATLATLLALALSAALAGPALAVPVTIPGAPLTV